VFLLDASKSMFRSGLFPSAKNAALALGELIQSQYPDDVGLFVVFDYLAKLVPFSDLSNLGVVQADGTNLQHAIFLARALLTSYPTRDKRIVIITDGLPTAHMEPGVPEPVFDYPTTQRCIAATLPELESAVRERIVVTIFLLNTPAYAEAFVRVLDVITEGHVFHVEPDNLKDRILAYYRRP
jgi:uncharacterized protein with von Willebrand factor type A (vWA) domain